MGKYRKIISIIMLATFVFPQMEYFSLHSYAQELSEERQYIIVMKNKGTYDEVEEEVLDSITVETPVLSENNVIVAELTENEAEALADKKDLLIEEDIIISASTAEEYTDHMNNLNIKGLNRKKRKEKSKHRKEKFYRKLRQDEKMKGARFEWNLQAINIDEVVKEEDTSQQKVKVAVMDSGVDYSTGINLAGYVNFVEEEQEISPLFQDMTGHGTGIASIIAGNGKNDIYGVNPNVELYSVKVLDKENMAPLSRIIRGIYWCIENEIDIINMSFGTTTYSKTLERAVKDAYSAGLLMIGAAGNGSGDIEYPAAFGEVMAVASTNAEAEISTFSNSGKELDIAAPGEKIKTIGYFNGTVVTHGTSIAVPHVTGVASLLWERDLTKSNEFIRRLIKYSAKEILGIEECGLLDAKYAMEVYEPFSQNFDESGLMQGTQIPENMEAPEKFAYIEEDDAYVEGRWSGVYHKDAVEQGKIGFSAEAIDIIKRGAVYPDSDASGWKSGSENPRWHGKWLTLKGENLNYIACLEMITEIALVGGNTSSFTDYEYFSGMNQATFDALKRDITKLNYNLVLSGRNTSENRKYFLWGCALHTITDTFAHSTTKPDGTLIGHGLNNGTHPDDISYYPRRYAVAVKIVQYSMQNLKEGVYSDGLEVVDALKSEYKDQASYKIIKIKRYAKENGYNAAVLSQATIDNPK